MGSMGKENDKDFGTAGLTQDYGFRLYNPAIAKFLSVDPLSDSYPWYTPYQFAGNKPIEFIDRDGLEEARPDMRYTYLGFGLRHPISSLRIGVFGVTKGATDINTNSVRFATRGKILYGSSSDRVRDRPKDQADEGTENGAFRHALWQASIASEFGSEIAAEAGYTHEENPYVDLTNRKFNKYSTSRNPKSDPNLTDADQTADLLNNQIGRKIGHRRIPRRGKYGS